MKLCGCIIFIFKILNWKGFFGEHGHFDIDEMTRLSLCKETLVISSAPRTRHQKYPVMFKWGTVVWTVLKIHHNNIQHII